MKISPIEEILVDIRQGKAVVLVDDDDRENEGDITIAAEKVTPELINFMMTEGRGLICISLTRDRIRELGISMQVSESQSGFGTNFAVSFDHKSVASDAQTASSRAKTIFEAVSDQATASDFVQPGFMFPVVSVPGGVLRRRGQTEGSVDLARLAGLKPAGVICEVMSEDGEMLRGEKLWEFCEKFDLKLTSVEELVQYRLRNESAVREVGRSFIDSPVEGDSGGKFEVIVFKDDVDNKEHLAIVRGKLSDSSQVRIHSECLTGDVFESTRCDCGFQFDTALKRLVEEDNGLIIYLHQEGRGIGLSNKLRAYALQDQGYDTVEANLKLGFSPDERDYRPAAQIIKKLGLKSVKLMTNNPAKIASLESFGIEIVERLPIVAPLAENNKSYLLTKKDKMGHLF